jgi:hypothetical protein
MRKRAVQVVVGLVLVALAAVALMPRTNPVCITSQSSNLINGGMSQAEVRAILGPPGDYASGPTEPDGPSEYGRIGGCWPPGRTPPQAADVWVTDSGAIAVYFGEQGAQETCFRPSHRIDQSPVDNLLWRVKRRWRKWFPG